MTLSKEEVTYSVTPVLLHVRVCSNPSEYKAPWQSWFIPLPPTWCNLTDLYMKKSRARQGIQEKSITRARFISGLCSCLSLCHCALVLVLWSLGSIIDLGFVFCFPVMPVSIVYIFLCSFFILRACGLSIFSSPMFVLIVYSYRLLSSLVSTFLIIQCV